MNFEIRIVNKACDFISLYGSPNQSLQEIETFADNLEVNLDATAKKNNNPFLNVLLSDLNARSSNWYKNDSTWYEGAKINDITS